MQMMKKAIRQQRYRLKKKYFDPFPLHLVSKTSPVKSLNDEQWNDLVELWKTPETMVCFFLQNKLMHCGWYYDMCIACFLCS